MNNQAEKEKAAGAATHSGTSGNHALSIAHEFRKAMSHAGIDTAAELIGDGQIHRVHITGDNPGTENGWYKLHLDGKPAGAFGSWKTGAKHTWTSDTGTGLMSEAEHAALKARIEAAKAERQAETEARQSTAAAAAADVWAQSKPADPEHPYLVRKQVGPHGIRQAGEDLIVPVLDKYGKITSFSQITPDGDKRFHPGGKIQGGFFLIGDPQPKHPLYVAEGYATSATIHELTGCAVAIAFNCGNLEAVALAMRDLHPESRLVVACDDDGYKARRQNIENAGIVHGLAAAKAVGAAYVIPQFKGGTPGEGQSDFNDLFAAEGKFAVLASLDREFQTTWPELKPTALAPLPEFPWEAMPPVLADHARQVAAVYQVPAEYPALAALTVGGFSMGNRTFCELKPGVAVRANLYTMIYMASGERKSSAYRPLVEPLEIFASEHLEGWERLQRERRIYRAKCERIEKMLADPKLDKDDEELWRHELSKLVEPAGSSKDFLTSNATPEALEARMAEAGGRAAVFSADSRDFLEVLQGIYSNGQNRESIYLKGYDGDAIMIHRMGREIDIDKPAISMLLLVQCDKLAELGGNDGLHAGGFIPRLIQLVPDSLVGTRFWHETGLDPELQRQYSEAVLARLERYSDQAEDHFTPIAPEAKALWIEFYNGMEEAMAGDLREHAAQAVRWQSLPVRLGLILAEYHGHAEITEGDMAGALRLTEYLIEHGKRAAGLMRRGLSSDLSRVVSHIREKKMKSFVPNDIHKVTRQAADWVTKKLADLEALGYVRQTGQTQGNKHAPIYEANPRIWGEITPDPSSTPIAMPHKTTPETKTALSVSSDCPQANSDETLISLENVDWSQFAQMLELSKR